MLRERGLYHEWMWNSHPLSAWAWKCFSALSSLCPACASCYPNLSTSFLCTSLSNPLGFQSFCKPPLLQLSARAQMLAHLDARLNAAWTTHKKQQGEKACIFHWLISHHSLFCLSQQGKLAHAELSATVGEMFLLNQRPMGYDYTIHISLCTYIRI